MNHAHTRIIANYASAADKRAFPRISLELAAVCAVHGSDQRLDCVIRDYCNAGMRLAFADDGELPSMAEGAMIRIAARWPQDSSGQVMQFRGRIVRRMNDGIGIALTTPDPQALAVLADCASQQAGQAQAATRSGRIEVTGSRDELLRDCHQQTRQAVEALATEIITELNQAGSGLGQPAMNTPDHQALLEARKRIRDAREQFSAHYRLSALSRVEEQLALVSGQAPDHRQTAEPEFLSLVGEQELEDWLFVSDLAGRLEADHRAALADLEARLGHLTGETVTHQNNPFGPQVFVQAFQDAVGVLKLPHRERKACFDMLQPLLSNWLGALCRQLNEHLKAAGVYSTAENVVRPVRASDATPAAAQRSDATHRQDPHRDLHDLFNELHRLRTDYGHLEATPAPSAATTTVDSDTLIALLNRLQGAAGPGTGSNADTGTDGHHQRLVNRLQSMVPATTQLGPRESGIIDLADNLFTSMTSDRLLPPSVQSWIHRLEIPLLKLALADDSLFVDSGHVAREVVNHLSRLEVYDGANDQGSDAIHREIDRLVESIAGEETPDARTFTRALKKLKLLVGMQTDAYQDNLRDVLEACAQEDALRTEADDAAAPDISDDPALAEWLQRCQRLRVGDWLLFATDPACPQRLRLAWVSKQRDRFVFVNLRGLREATLDTVTLARQLSRGDAVVMESADEPVLDRAQYTMLQTLHHQLLYETSHDQLTGLLNRRELERRVQEALDNTRCLGEAWLLHHIDIAQFNIINTSCGTRAGDRLLVEVASLLSRTAGDEAAIARVGSDEFCILVDADVSAATPLAGETTALAERITGAISDYRFRHDDQDYPVAIGIGIVDTRGFEQAGELLQAAESSCRSARAAGLNKIDVYHADGFASSEQSQAAHWLTRIDKALSEGSLELRCQRILPAAAVDEPGAVHHSEILLGITDEHGAFISPQDFILTAEHYQRMPSIDRWVIENTFAFMREHPAVLDEVGGFAINISGCSLSDPAFRDFVREAIATSGVPMDRVCFEITETAGISSLSDASDFILETKQTGCLFSLDDFGSGLSSYIYLKNLPVDFLKIDGDFVSNMDNNPADFAVVKSITEIGHFMGKKVIAERVESDSVLRQLQGIGVDYVQGYVVERPRRLKELL